jgi:PAS domain S-box-containing protein
MHLYVLLGVLLAVPVTTLGLWQRHEKKQERAAELDRQLVTRARDVANEIELMLDLRGTDRLQARVDGHARLSQARVVVVDGAGVVLADSVSRKAAPLRGEPLAPQAEGQARAGRGQDEEGRETEVRQAWARVNAGDRGWRVMVSMSKERFTARVAAIDTSTLWVTSFAALVTVGIMLLVGQGMRKNVGRLAQVARRIGEGDFRPHAQPISPILPREVGELWHSMDATLRLLDEGDRARQALISDLQRAHEQARWLTAGLRDTQDGILVLDRERKIAFVNPAWLRMREMEGRDVLGQPASEVASMENVPPSLIRDIEQKLRARRPWRGTVSSKQRDGVMRVFELSISPVFDDKGEIDYYVELARDVTERREAEQAIQQSERLASLGLLAAGMAHEINNPMTYVLGNLEHLQELTQEGTLKVDAAAELDLQLCLDDSLHGARRVVEIVGDLQALSRQKQDTTSGQASALQTLETCVRMAQSQIRHCAEVVRDFPTDDVWLSINPQKLSQVLLNLILNAVQAMSPAHATSNKLTLTVRTLAGAKGEITVRDTGSGMPVEIAQRIFDPFFTTKGTGGGTGLGLSISHSIVAAAHGEITVESEPGKGTAFRVVLPLSSLAENEPAPQSASLRGLSVLVVDDEPGVLTAIRRMLASCRTATATSVKQALEMIEHDHYDLVLSDVMMAESSGVELVNALRVRAPELARRVCLMSAGVIGGELVQQVKSIGVPLLHKPMTSSELHEALWQVHHANA